MMLLVCVVALLAEGLVANSPEEGKPSVGINDKLNTQVTVNRSADILSSGYSPSSTDLWGSSE